MTHPTGIARRHVCAGGNRGYHGVVGKQATCGKRRAVPGRDAACSGGGGRGAVRSSRGGVCLGSTQRGRLADEGRRGGQCFKLGCVHAVQNGRKRGSHGRRRGVSRSPTPYQPAHAPNCIRHMSANAAASFRVVWRRGHKALPVERVAADDLLGGSGHSWAEGTGAATAFASSAVEVLWDSMTDSGPLPLPPPAVVDLKRQGRGRGTGKSERNGGDCARGDGLAT